MTMPSRIGRTWWVLFAALGIGALLWLVSSPADAHDGLRSANPGPGTHLAHTPGTVQLDFGQRLSAGGRATVAVVGPDDVDLARGSASTSTLGVSQRIASPERRGAYQVSYRVVDTDGHVISGRYWFWNTPSTPRWAAIPWSAAYVLLGLMAVGALGLSLLRHRREAPLVATPRITPLVPAQRSRDDHHGASPPSRRPLPLAPPLPLPGHEVVEDNAHPHGSTRD